MFSKLISAISRVCLFKMVIVVDMVVFDIAREASVVPFFVLDQVHFFEVVHSLH